MKLCPKCGSTELYRKDPQSWIVNCDHCQHQFKKHPIKPIAFKEGYMAKKKSYRVSIWQHTEVEGSYCYGVSINGGIMAGGDVPGTHGYLFGCYPSVEEALVAGLKEVQDA
jgi:hypothetical protein